MKKLFLKLNLNQKLALFILILAFIAIFAGSPYRGTFTTFDSKELALILEKKTDQIQSGELADWIIKGRSDYKLLDLRSEKEFTEYSIPSAQNISLTKLGDLPLNRNDKIVLYAENAVQSAQAWFLLKALGFKGVYMLAGGLMEWKDKILFPKIPDNATAEQVADLEKIKEVSRFFGGIPQTGSKEESIVSKPSLPKLEMPSTSSSAPVQSKKKKEGC